MQPRTPKLLEDIRDAAAFIREVTTAETPAGYSTNRLWRQAVERNFEIIGEAMRRLEQRDPATARRITDYGRIIAFRNLPIHGYDLIDHALVWDTIQRQLRTLPAEVGALLAEAG